MYNFIMEFKWIILMMLEFCAWVTTFFMFYARYKMQSQFWFRAASLLLVLTGVIPQILLGLLNYITNKQVDAFTVIIIVIIIYGLTIGKRDVKKIDAWAKERFTKKIDIN